MNRRGRCDTPTAAATSQFCSRPRKRRRSEYRCGGAGQDGNTGLASAQIIDLTNPDPAWRELAPMANPRWFPNSALLPDGTLFVVGGGRRNNADPVMEPEIFDPVSET